MTISGGAATIRERHLIERIQYAKLLVTNRVYARSSCYVHHNIIYIAKLVLEFEVRFMDTFSLLKLKLALCRWQTILIFIGGFTVA